MNATHNRTYHNIHSKQSTAPMLYFIQNPIWTTPMHGAVGDMKRCLPRTIWGQTFDKCWLLVAVFNPNALLVCSTPEKNWLRHFFSQCPHYYYTHQPTNPPLVSHYFTPTKIELAGQNLFWHPSFKYWAPIAGHFIWSALSAKSLHCCKSLHFGVILTLWKQWNLLRCKISIAPHHLIWSTSYTCHPGHAVCGAPKKTTSHNAGFIMDRVYICSVQDLLAGSKEKW